MVAEDESATAPEYNSWIWFVFFVFSTVIVFLAYHSYRRLSCVGWCDSHGNSCVDVLESRRKRSSSYE